MPPSNHGSSLLPYPSSNSRLNLAAVSWGISIRRPVVFRRPGVDPFVKPRGRIEAGKKEKMYQTVRKSREATAHPRLKGVSRSPTRNGGLWTVLGMGTILGAGSGLSAGLRLGG
ncbi:hypothetical protein HYQ46_000002 [Verticillium longisporum]|nr:hypothetical protein HYQ46_000002 [Verticillium longisporum]